MKNDLLKNAGIIGGITLLFIGDIVFFLLPQHKTVASLADKIYDERVHVELVKRQASSLVETQAGFHAIESDAKQLEVAFIPKTETIQFISSLESLASDRGITQKISLEGLTLPSKTSKTQAEVQEVPLELSLSGSPSLVISYIRDLELLPHYININKIEMSGADESITARVSAKTFWR